MVLLDFEQAIIEKAEQTFPEITNHDGQRVHVIQDEDMIEYVPPAVVIQFKYDQMEAAPERIESVVSAKDMDTYTGETTIWHPYDLPLSIGIRVTQSARKMTEYFERLLSEWGKHLIVQDVPMDLTDFSRPVTENMRARNVEYEAWINLRGKSDEAPLVEQNELKLVQTEMLVDIDDFEYEVDDLGFTGDVQINKNGETVFAG